MNTGLFAPILINNYIWHEIGLIDPAFTSNYTILPFFPLYDNQAGNSKWGNKSYVVYDNLIKPKRGLYVTKKENLLYSIHGVIPEIYYFRDLVNYVIDRSDDAGKDINEWAGGNVVGNKIFFHAFSTFELNWGAERNIAKDTRQPYTKDLIIDYEYHFANYHNDGNQPFIPPIPGPDQGDTQYPQPSFNWNQATPAGSWVINHNLGFKPIVQVFENSGQQMEGLVVHTTLNQAVIYFTVPVSGYARLV